MQTHLINSLYGSLQRAPLPQAFLEAGVEAPAKSPPEDPSRSKQTFARCLGVVGRSDLALLSLSSGASPPKETGPPERAIHTPWREEPLLTDTIQQLMTETELTSKDLAESEASACRLV